MDGKGALHRQLYRALRAAILEGRLRAGERLPSTRALAGELDLSRNTVLQAYEQLMAEGYAEPRSGAGTYVAASLASSRPGPRAARAPQTVKLAQSGRRLTGATSGTEAWALRGGSLPYDFRQVAAHARDLPLTSWARIVGRRARRLSAQHAGYGPAAGLPELREALAAFLARTRGVSCTPEQVVIVSGVQHALDLTGRLLVDPGDRVALEEPHYAGFRASMRAAGARLCPIPIDAEGMRVDVLAARSDVKLACVTPTHHFPTGVSLPLARRLELLAWARARDAYLVEDDYAIGLRDDEQPLECLQSLDRDGRVIYLGTATTLLFPGLRLGWIVAPTQLVQPFVEARAASTRGESALEQLALADFIREGLLERHMRRMRTQHKERRRVLLEALAQHFGARVEVRGEQAAQHVLIRLDGVSVGRVDALLDECEKRGVGAHATAHAYVKPHRDAELVLGVAGLGNAEIREGVKRLKQAVELTHRARRRESGKTKR
ncbi:MAG: PLP-dependent aminotransferase family protein [Polyangiales bacterium]